MGRHSYRAQVPTAVAEYFNKHPLVGDDWSHPVIVQEFTPGAGWRRTGFNKRISGAWSRKLRHRGVTAVSVIIPGTNIQADFNIREVVR